MKTNQCTNCGRPLDSFEEKTRETCSICHESRKKKIKAYLQGIPNLSPCTQTEPYFGKAPCETCGSTKAGDRYEFIGTLGKKHTPVMKISCCVDCYGWLFT